MVANSTDHPVGDRTYADLPAIGEGIGNPLLATFGQFLGVESATVRSTYIDSNGVDLDQSMSLYLYGRQDGYRGDPTPTVNLIQGTINTFTAQACRVAALITMRASSIGADGKWYLTRPYTFHAPDDPKTGQPIINPDTGQPYQDVPLQLYQQIPDELVDQVPDNRKICIDSDTVIDYYQSIFDIQRRESRMDQVIRDMILQKQLVGWPMGLFQWDPILNLPVWRLYPPHQWFPDPTEPDVKDMVYVRLDLILDSEKAKRLYPYIANKIDEFASRSLYFSEGSTGYSQIYLQTFQRPVVTLTVCFLRNQEAPMTLSEAIQTGTVNIQVATSAYQPPPQMGESPTANGAEDQETSEDDEEQPTAVDTGDAGGSGEADEDAETNAPPALRSINHPVRGQITGHILHTLTGENLNDSFDEDGNPAVDEDGAATHPNHPKKLVNRQWIQIREQVVSDEVCPEWDFPIFLDKNVPIPNRPFAQPETERLSTLQRDRNDTHVTMVSHVGWFKGPTFIMDEEKYANLPEDFKNGHAKPDKIYLVKGDGSEAFDIKSAIYTIPAPEMPAAVPQVAAIIKDAYESVAGHPGVDQGTPPPDVSSGKAILALQSQSQASAGFKSMYSEEAIWRMSKLASEAQARNLNEYDLFRMNSSIPLQLLPLVIAYRRMIVVDIDVELNTGASQVRAEEDAKIRADFGAQIIDKETAREKLRYDAQKIEMREDEQRRKEMQEQAQAAANAGGQGKSAGPNISIQLGYQYLQPEAQSGVLQMIGLPPLTQPHTVSDVQNAAKIQNEAARTAVEAHTKLGRMNQPNPPNGATHHADPAFPS